MKKVVLIFAAVFFCQLNNAQEEKQDLKDSPISFSADLKTNHLWRGLIITDKPMIGVITIIKWNKSGSLSGGFWGGMAFSNDKDGTHYKEINYYMQYASNGFSIGLWDLFNTRNVVDPDVWDYDKNSTGHFLDLRTSYNFGDNFPLVLEVDVLLYGKGDAPLEKENMKQRYSTYLQVSYPLIRESKVDLNAFVGGAFSLNGETHLYGDGQKNFDLVNIGLTASKTLKLLDLRIPVSATTLWNPSLKVARVQLAAKIF